MSTNFPTSLDSYTTRSSGDTISEDHMNNVQDAIESLEAKVGIDDSAVTTSHDYKLTHLLNGNYFPLARYTFEPYVGNTTGSWANLTYDLIKCPPDPKSIRFYAYCWRASGSGNQYMRGAIATSADAAVVTGSNITITATTVTWHDLGLLDASSLTPGTLYMVKFMWYGDTTPLRVRAISAWWE